MPSDTSTPDPVEAAHLAGAQPLNLARLDLVSLRLAVCCANSGSISAAAAECHFSVMGASDRLRRLEDAFGKPLFQRHRQGVIPTQAGEVLVRLASQILENVNSLAEHVRRAPVSGRGSNTGRSKVRS